jgi:hypothetical protein
MREGTYDTMQVCMSGHWISSSYEDYPEFNKAFCPECGEPTTTLCPACKARIKGAYRGVFSASEHPVPSFCDACGMAYPWQVARIANALEVLRLQGLSEAEVREVEQNLPDIARDNPRTQAAALRIRKLLGKAGKPVYDVCIKVIGDIAAATAKSHLGL